MSSRTGKIVSRREALIVRAAAQRAQIAAAASRLRASLWFANLAVSAYRLVKSRPLWATLVLSVLAVAGPPRALRWAYRGVTLFATFASLAKVFAELLQRLRAVP
ncbi:MAG TPA: YqjK family protein [Lysobacter sp.]|nr:YqjK family protein [Lysobacter sp.]